MASQFVTGYLTISGQEIVFTQIKQLVVNVVIGNVDKDIDFLCEIKNKAWHRILIFNNMRENTALEKYQSWTKEPRAWNHLQQG